MYEAFVTVEEISAILKVLPGAAAKFPPCKNKLALLESVVVPIVTLPAIVDAPLIPAPPLTTNAPVVVEVEAVELATVNRLKICVLGPVKAAATTLPVEATETLPGVGK
jgi:hypothetical protein